MCQEFLKILRQLSISMISYVRASQFHVDCQPAFKSMDTQEHLEHLPLKEVAICKGIRSIFGVFVSYVFFHQRSVLPPFAPWAISWQRR
jgi:hypothetical protein